MTPSVSASGDTNPSDDATATGDCMLKSADDFDRAMLLLLLKSVEVDDDVALLLSCTVLWSMCTQA